MLFESVNNIRNHLHWGFHCLTGAQAPICPFSVLLVSSGLLSSSPRSQSTPAWQGVLWHLGHFLP